MFAVDAKGLVCAMKEDLEAVRRTGWDFEKIVIEGGARGVMNRREGQRSWWGRGIVGEIPLSKKSFSIPGRVRQD
jgi:hypothetical protein